MTLGSSSVAKRMWIEMKYALGTIDIGNGSAEIFKDSGYAKSYCLRLSYAVLLTAMNAMKVTAAIRKCKM